MSTYKQDDMLACVSERQILEISCIACLAIEEFEFCDSERDAAYRTFIENLTKVGWRAKHGDAYCPRHAYKTEH